VLEYFRQQDWEDEWIDNVENLIQEEYIVNYKGKGGLVTPAPNIVEVCPPMHLAFI
jgi:hypothetical protein